MTVLRGMQVEDLLPPSTHEFKEKLVQELRLAKSRREKLSTCERFLNNSASQIGENQLQFEIARDIVERDQLYTETHRSIKQWEESLGIGKLQRECSKDHKDSVTRATKQFHSRTGVWPWNILVEEQKPTSWSQPILQGLAKLAVLRPTAGDISHMLQTAIQERGGKVCRQRGLSKAGKLVPADIITVIESIEGSQGTTKKRKRGFQKASRKRVKNKGSAEKGVLEGGSNDEETARDMSRRDTPAENTDEAYLTRGTTASGKTTDGGAVEIGGSPEKGTSHYETSTTRGSADLCSVGKALRDAAQPIDRRTRVEDEQESDSTSHQSLPQEPPHTPQNTTRTVAGLPTPGHSIPEPILERTHATRIGNPPSQSHPSHVVNMPFNSLSIANIAFNDSQDQLTEAENQLCHIEAAQREIGRRLAYCESLTAVPSLHIREIQRELTEVAEMMAKPYAMLKAQKAKANAMRAQARTLYEMRNSTAKMWAIVSAWAKSQARKAADTVDRDVVLSAR